MDNLNKILVMNVPSFEQTIAHLIESIALEEEAISKLLDCEASKALAFVGKEMDFPSNPSSQEIINFNQTVLKLMDSFLMTEWLLLKKLDMVIHTHSQRSNGY